MPSGGSTTKNEYRNSSFVLKVCRARGHEWCKPTMWVLRLHATRSTVGVTRGHGCIRRYECSYTKTAKTTTNSSAMHGLLLNVAACSSQAVLKTQIQSQFCTRLSVLGLPPPSEALKAPKAIKNSKICIVVQSYLIPPSDVSYFGGQARLTDCILCGSDLELRVHRYACAASSN